MSTKPQHILYPFANQAHIASHPPLCIMGGDDVWVDDAQGKRYLDGQGGLWNVNVGHGRPEMKLALVEQMEKISFYSMFGGTTNEPAEQLADELCRLAAQEDMSRVFYSGGGSEANESAFKLSRQYWRLQGAEGRHKIVSLRRAYHGVTLGALSACGTTAYRAPYEPLLAGFSQVDTPYFYRNPYTGDPLRLGEICADLLEREIIYQGPESVAAVVAEPVQGAGGVIVPPANFWPLIRAVCDRHDVLLIADEVVTGFGRTGCMFGSRGWGVKPDLMVFAKGINSGYVPLGATMINRRVAQAFERVPAVQFDKHAFFHGTTYNGHPLACATALANLRIIENERLVQSAGAVGDYFLQALTELQARHDTMGDVRGKGLMLAIEFVRDKTTREPFDLGVGHGARISSRCRELGVLVRNLADTFIISPPLTLQREHVDTMVAALDQAISEAEAAR